MQSPEFNSQYIIDKKKMDIIYYIIYYCCICHYRLHHAILQRSASEKYEHDNSVQKWIIMIACVFNLSTYTRCLPTEFLLVARRFTCIYILLNICM